MGIQDFSQEGGVPLNCRIPVVLENLRSSQGGGEVGANPCPLPQDLPQEQLPVIVRSEAGKTKNLMSCTPCFPHTFHACLPTK